MNNWPTKKLAELLETCDAGTWGKPAPEGKGLLVLRSTNMTNGGGLDFADVAELDIQDKVENLKLLNGDILLEKSGGGPDQPVGRVVYFMTPNHRVYAFANFIQRLRADSRFIDSHFLFYRLFFLHKIGFTKKLQSQTTGIRNLKMSLYLKTEIPLPPLAIQKQIVERMDKIAEARKLNDKLVQKSDELFQSLLHQEFDPASKNWEVKKLPEVAKIQRGKFTPRPRNDPKYFTGNIPWIQTGDITNSDGTIYNYSQTLNEEGLKVSRIFPKGTIVITIAANIGDLAILGIDAAFPDSIVGIIIDESIIDNKFLYFQMLLQRGYLNNQATQAAQKNINLRVLSKVNVYLPSKNEQKQIVAKLSAAQEYKKQLLVQKSKLRELFDSVLHKSMNGELMN